MNLFALHNPFSGYIQATAHPSGLCRKARYLSVGFLSRKPAADQETDQVTDQVKRLFAVTGPGRHADAQRTPQRRRSQAEEMTRSVPGVRKGSEERTDLAPSPLDTPAPFAPRLKLWSFLPPLQHSKAAPPHKKTDFIESPHPESTRAREQKYRLTAKVRGKEVGYGN
jgi:hypothetical protein